MNKYKPLIIGGVVLLLLCSLLMSLILCSIGISIYEDKYQQNKLNTEKLTYKIDSLETVINTDFKNKKDTIIINVIPQDIRIYQK